MQRLILFTLWIAATMAALTGLRGVARAADQKPAHGKKSPDPFLTGDPFTLDQLLLVLPSWQPPPFLRQSPKGC